jgi:hypothetical protein
LLTLSLIQKKNSFFQKTFNIVPLLIIISREKKNKNQHWDYSNAAPRAYEKNTCPNS